MAAGSIEHLNNRSLLKIHDAYRTKMINISTFPNSETLIDAIVELLAATLPTAGNLMLSGGRTPYLAYNRLADSPCAIHPQRRIFLSDERMVPLDSPKNNSGNLMPMLKALGCTDRFIRIETERRIEEASACFAKALEPMESIDVGIIGMGADGHTAGFFTPEQARLKNGPLTLHTDRPDGMQGVSVTSTIYRRTEHLILLAMGEEKRSILHTLLNEPETIAVGIALADHPQVDLWTDLDIEI